MFILINSHSLPQNTINVTNPSLTLTVVNDHFDFNYFVLEEDEFVHLCFNADIIGGLHAREAPLASHATFEIKLLICVTLNRLLNDCSKLIFLSMRLFLLFNFFHV